MVQDHVKKAAITAVGFDYQTFFGLRIICDWLASPNRYTRICFEADERSIAPQSLDDVVAERADGKSDYWQVKYTPSPDNDKNSFNWKWLLDVDGKTDRARSLIKKLFDGLSKIGKDRLGSATLITNRVPDREIEATLKAGKYLKFDTAPQHIQEELIKQIGNQKDIEWLFSSLCVVHSDKGFVNLEAEITNRLKQYGASDEAIATIKNDARNWSHFKNASPSDSWITLKDIQNLLSPSPPRPINEEFEISDDYCLPSHSFHQEVIAKISTSTEKILVFTGPPGRGKSTYLSYLCNELRKSDIPYIRHHYFLSVENRDRDRISPHIVHRAFIEQIKQLHDVPIAAMEANQKQLYEILEECAKYYQGMNKRFIIIFDGLDHVWRDNAHDIKPLNELFRELLPIPDNAVLLIGTQPVADNQLPPDLIVQCPRNTWLVVPAMSEDSVKNYLQKQIDKKRLTVQTYHDGKNDLPDSAVELCRITNGHPLHVIYATEYLINKGNVLSSWKVKGIPGVLNNSTQSYYESFWLRLSYAQRELLYLIARFNFTWPSEALINQSLIPNITTNDRDSILHLLHMSEVGVSIFHNSLSIFALEKFKNQNNDPATTQRVIDWLRCEAPVHIKEMWLWRTEALNGNPDILINSLGRTWLIDRLSEGYLASDLEDILYAAVCAAFDNKTYHTAYKIHHLQDRLTSGPEYQLEDSIELLLYSWRLTQNRDIMKDISSRKAQLMPKELAALAIAYYKNGDLSSAQKINEYVIKRYVLSSIKLDYHQGHSNEPKWHWLGYAIGLINVTGISQELLEAAGRENFGSFWHGILKGVIDSNDLCILQEFYKHVEDPHGKKIIENAIVRLAAIEGACPGRWNIFASASANPLLGCWLYLESGGSDTTERFAVLQDEQLESHRREDFSDYIHDWFFNQVLAIFFGSENPQTNPLTAPYESKEKLYEYVNMLITIAPEIASKLQRKESISFNDFYGLLPEQDKHRNPSVHDLWTDNIFNILVKIALDCHLLSSAFQDTFIPISQKSLESLIDNPWFRFGHFRNLYAESHYCLLNEEAANWLLDYYENHDCKQLMETNNHAVLRLDLCKIAVLHNLNERAKYYQREAWIFSLSYSWRKDLTICSLIDAIEMFIDFNPNESLKLIQSIAPQIQHISDYTDGDETRHARTNIDDLLVRLSLSQLVQKYRDNTDTGEWYLAENTMASRFKGDLNSPILPYLAKTGLSKMALGTLIDRKNKGDIVAEKLYEIACLHNGVSAQGISTEKDNHDTPAFTIQTDNKIEFSDFDPKNLKSLLQRLNGWQTYEAEQYFNKWFHYWSTKNREADIFNSISECSTTGSFKNIELKGIQDALFEVCRQLYGKAKAFPYIVAAHKDSFGWSDYYYRHGKPEQRLQIVANLYPEKGDEFIQKTCFDYYGKRMAPGKRLVYFLLKTNRINEACQLLQAMVDAVREDTDMLHLTMPSWGICHTQIPQNSEVKADIQFLIERQKWPVPSVKWWSTQALTDLLANNDLSDITEEEITISIKNAKMESEALELLYACWLATKISDYQPSQQILQGLNLPTVATDLLIEDMIGIYHNSTNYKYPLDHVPLFYHNEKSDFSYVDKHLPRIYTESLAYLAKHSYLPFSKQLQYEWDELAKRFPEYPLLESMDELYEEPSSRDRIGLFISRGTQRIYSAFLRTLTVAQKEWNVPEPVIYSRICLNNPFNPVLMPVKPRRPEWFMPFTGLLEEFEEETINKYLLDISINIENLHPGNSLLYLSFQQKMDATNCIVEFDFCKCAQWSNRAVSPDSMMKSFMGSALNLCPQPDSAKNELFSGERFLPPVQIEKILDHETSSMPIAGMWCSYNGLLHSAIWLRGIAIPKSTVNKEMISVKPTGDGLNMYLNEDLLSHWTYWNMDWEATHIRHTRGPLCATASVANTDLLKNLWEEQPLRYFFAWRCSLIECDAINSTLKKEIYGAMVPCMIS